VRVTYKLYVLPVDLGSGETVPLVVEGDTSIVSERLVDNGVDPHVQVVTRTAHYDDEAQP
jgi:hypothetical protein